ncbi:MAG: 3-oxoacyl-[acyl-carrier-protein] synthase III C-terminal domain-containing protein, partial [Arachnia sp.]
AAQAIDRSGVAPAELDCVISACAAGIQPIPCTAALVMEQVAPKAPAAALDINTTCTSFITALDIASRFLADGQYSNILIVAGDVGTRFLSPERRESYELFSDAAAAVVVSSVAGAPGAPGVIASLQQTWPEHAHDTELRGGLSLHPAQSYPDGDPADYLFDMHPRRTLTSMLAVLPGFFARFFTETGLDVSDFSAVIPHQASPALSLAMRRIGIPIGRYIDRVAEYGNMVSASVPYTLVRSLDQGLVTRGETVLLCGTAAGLTANCLALRV